MSVAINGRNPPPPPPAIEGGAPAAKRRPSAAPSAGGGYTRRGGDDLAVAVWALGGPLTLTLLCSCIEAAYYLTLCYSSAFNVANTCGSLQKYQISLGLISAIAIVAYLFLFTFARQNLHEKSMLFLSGFLFLWWLAGVFATTFQIDYTSVDVLSTSVGIGYFATWLALGTSLLVTHSEWEQFQILATRVQALEFASRETVYLFFVSCVNLASAIAAIVDAGVDGYTVYAIIIPPISIIISLIFLRLDPERLGGADKILALFLCLWWAVGMAVTTIGGPFFFVGNGFFSAIFAVYLSIQIAQAKVFPVSENALNEGV